MSKLLVVWLLSNKKNNGDYVIMDEQNVADNKQLWKKIRSLLSVKEKPTENKFLLEWEEITNTAG